MIKSRPNLVVQIYRSLLKKRIRLQAFYHKIMGRTVISYFHIGKTDGTALKRAFNNDHTYVTDNYTIFFHPHNVTISDTKKGEKIFFFLREPATRFVSGFNSKKYRSTPILDHPWLPKEKKVFDKFNTPNDLAEAIYSSDLELQKEAQESMRTIGHVRTHYTDWHGSLDHLQARKEDILMIGYQENLQSDFNRLKLILNLPHEIRLPQSKHKSNKSSSNWSKELSDKAKINLMVWYAEDYQIYFLAQRISPPEQNL